MIKDNTKITKAVWDTSQYEAKYPTLMADLSVDVAIVGGGITGVTAAYLLASAGKKVTVLEAKEIGKGSTGYSTGNLYIPVGQRFNSIKSKHNQKTLEALARSREAAVNFIEEQVLAHRIDCAFERVPWHLFTTEDTKRIDKDIIKEYETAQELQLSASNNLPENFPIQNVSEIATIYNQAQFNPLHYVQGLAKAIPQTYGQVFENTPAIELEDGQEGCSITTEKGKVFADKVIVATHSPKGIYAVHTAMEVHREYVLAAKLKTRLPPKGIYWHAMSSQQYSIRPYIHGGENYLLVLGEPHLVGNKEHNEENLKKIEAYLYQHFEVERIVYRWAAQNYKPADGLPYIGMSPMQKSTFIATGFAADGLTYGTLAAMIISDIIIGRNNKWASFFDPKRFTPIASAAQFMKENWIVGSHLLKDYLFYGNANGLKNIKVGEGKTLTVEGEKVAAYRDETNQLHIVSSICPHMGCIVHWNHAERSWDCPCHGSRFSIDGEVLEGPALHALSKPAL